VRRLAARRGVTVTGRVPDVRPYLANAAAVVPLRSGAGTRLKILEAMSMQCPVVSTRLGAEGLDVTPGGNLLIDDTPAGFANAVCAVLSNAEYADRLGREARRFVEARYTWARCLRGLDELYERIGAAPVAADHDEQPRELVGL
jgi:glycosyltransferase involved in cell wall biosynthesis